jgi:hypothetical protein
VTPLDKLRDLEARADALALEEARRELRLERDRLEAPGRLRDLVTGVRADIALERRLAESDAACAAGRLDLANIAREVRR